MAGLVLKTAPTVEPVTLDEAKSHLRIIEDHEDALISMQISAARQRVEGFIKSSLTPTVYEYKLAGFPDEIVLPIGPVLSPTVSISYVNDAGAATTLASSDYQLSTGEVGRVRPAYGYTWPATRPQLDAVTVEFTAGWTSAAAVPPVIKAALLLTLGDLFELRQNTVVAASAVNIPAGAERLLLPWVRH